MYVVRWLKVVFERVWVESWCYFGVVGGGVQAKSDGLCSTYARVMTPWYSV